MLVSAWRQTGTPSHQEASSLPAAAVLSSAQALHVVGAQCAPGQFGGCPQSTLAHMCTTVWTTAASPGRGGAPSAPCFTLLCPTTVGVTVGSAGAIPVHASCRTVGAAPGRPAAWPAPTCESPLGRPSAAALPCRRRGRRHVRQYVSTQHGAAQHRGASTAGSGRPSRGPAGPNIAAGGVSLAAQCQSCGALGC